MKYISGFVFGLFAIFFCSCMHPRLEEYEMFAHVITKQTAKKLKNEKELHLIGTGGQMMDDIQMMMMGFEFFHPIDVKEGRELLVFVINEYLSAINSDNKIRPYLHQFPFTSKNVEIKIWIRNCDGSRVSSDNIYYISAINGVLTYYIDDPENYSRIAINKETYEEALRAISTK